MACLWDCEVTLMILLFLEQCGITRDFWKIAIVRLVAAGCRGLAFISKLKRPDRRISVWTRWREGEETQRLNQTDSW